MRQKLLDALPFLAGDTSAHRWVLLQEDLLRAPNTVDAYARGVNDWLAFCHACGLTAVTAGHDTVAFTRLLSPHRMACTGCDVSLNPAPVRCCRKVKPRSAAAIPAIAPVILLHLLRSTTTGQP